MLVVSGLLVALMVAMRVEAVQDGAVERLARARIYGTAGEILAEDGLHVIVCGSGSPLPNPERAQACVVVFAGDRGYVFDVGAGSAGNMGQWRLPTEKVRHVFLTHFHSDHIADLYDVNLQGWTLGRGAPLQVHGPPGVVEVVDGYQRAYAHYRRYREQHHGAEMLPAAHGELTAVPFEIGGRPQVVHEEGEVRISAFSVDHSPIEPAVGYRVEYRGRSVVISGDTKPAPSLIEAYRGADLLLHEALAPHVVATLGRVAGEAGQPRSTRTWAISGWFASTAATLSRNGFERRRIRAESRAKYTLSVMTSWLSSMRTRWRARQRSSASAMSSSSSSVSGQPSSSWKSSRSSVEAGAPEATDRVLREVHRRAT